MIEVVFFIFILYAFFLCRTLYYWEKISVHSSKNLNHSEVRTAVVIAARNEEKDLPELLRCLSEQDYPKNLFEIIVTDDHSSDHTFEVAQNFFRNTQKLAGKVIRNSGEGKKNAITNAINETEAELIIITDADTTMAKDWISAIVSQYKESGSYLLCGPVRINGGRLIEKLQAAESIGLSVISAAGIQSNKPMMCNGANMAFRKDVFIEVNGFSDSKSVSGDDTQLLLKIHKMYPVKVAFLKDARAIVDTNALPVISEAWSQRRRWASKIPSTLTLYTVLIAALAWFVHAALIFLFVRATYTGVFLIPTLLFALKALPEILIIHRGGKFFQRNIPVWILIAVQPFYAIYIVLTGILLPFGKFSWKGRVST